jgi:hypothetical protein
MVLILFFDVSLEKNVKVYMIASGVQGELPEGYILITQVAVIVLDDGRSMNLRSGDSLIVGLNEVRITWRSPDSTVDPDAIN